MENNSSIEQLEKEAATEPITGPVSPAVSQPEKTAPIKKEEEGKEKPEANLREMLEKNLKWSQIIYEQNRRISRRLLWSLIASWIKWFLIIIVIILSVWYAWPIYRSFQSQYSAIINQLDPTKPIDKAGLEKILNMIPINSAQQEQIKGLLK